MISVALTSLCCFEFIEQGSSDIDQLGKIFAAFGTPTSSQWPDLVCLPDYVEYQYVPAPPLRSLFPVASDDALDLLSKMFTYDPKSRISAQQALGHRYVGGFGEGSVRQVSLRLLGFDRKYLKSTPFLQDQSQQRSSGRNRQLN